MTWIKLEKHLSLTSSKLHITYASTLCLDGGFEVISYILPYLFAIVNEFQYFLFRHEFQYLKKLTHDSQLNDTFGSPIKT